MTDQMKKIRPLFSVIFMLTIGLSLVFPALSAATIPTAATVELSILNPESTTGQIVVIAGTDVEVEFTINDPQNELSRHDTIRLVKVSTGEVISKKRRGHNLKGSVSLKTKKHHDLESNEVTGEFTVEYVHENDAIASAPNLNENDPILIASDQFVASILARLATLEQAYADGSLVGPQGPQGDAGPAGPQGPQGDIGPMGPQGDTGPQGLQGDTGPQGPQGLTGAVGPQGLQGLTGPAGPQGPQGDIGPMGPQGLQGDTGLQGPQGPQGDIGPMGPQGPQGDAGPQGLQGLTGPAGFQGPQGDIGPMGPQGPQGDTGLQGPQGLTGPAGPQGPQGIAGNLALANMSCQEGEAVVGFDANGNLRCAAVTTTAPPTAGVCGDGILDPGEQCDDGNNTIGDGCENCVIYAANSYCGDGIVDPGEQCDDGNSMPGDGCENDCTTTPPLSGQCSNLVAHADLSGCNFSGYDLSGLNLYGVDLSNSNLSYASLADVLVEYATISNANLLAADLTNADLSFVTLSSSNLTEAILAGADLYGATVNSADLTNANLVGANMNGANLNGSTLVGADLTGAALVNAVLTNVNFTDAILLNADVRGNANNLQNILWANTTCPDGTNSDDNGGTCIGHL